MKTLTTKEVARLCRVSDATVKRWDEGGILVSERTNGGHRRFRAEDVARFQRKQGLGQKLTLGDESAKSATTRRRENRSHSDCSLFHSIIAGREEEAADLLIKDYLGEKPIPEIFDNLVSSAMNTVGELWFAGEVTVAQEHLATRAMVNALHRVRDIIAIPEQRGELAFCCAIEGDYHELSLNLVQIILESQGWEVMNFGANTPLYSFAEEILHHSPDFICISATIMNDIERSARDYAEFRTKIAKLKIPVAIGGRVFNDLRIRQRFQSELHAENFSQLAEFTLGLQSKY